MRKDFGSKPMLYPMPVLIIGTYGEDGTPNAMNAAWGGIVDTNLIGICLADHKTTRNIFARKAFTVSMADAENMVAADYVGIVSGDKVPIRSPVQAGTPARAISWTLPSSTNCP